MSVIEFIAAFFGVLGALLVACNGRFAGWGFVAFFASNVGWLYFSFTDGHLWMFGQQIAFTATSLTGIYVWLVRDRLNACIDRLLTFGDTQ